MATIITTESASATTLPTAGSAQMASHGHATTEFLPQGQIAKPNTAWIWRTFWVLVAITGVEFLFVFFMHAGTLRNSIFIVLTIFKAFFIVGEFMHLKHETKGLIWTILIPMALLIWLLVALVTEGSYVGEALQNVFK